MAHAYAAVGGDVNRIAQNNNHSPWAGGRAVAAILTLGDGMAMLEIWDAKCMSSVLSKIC